MSRVRAPSIALFIFLVIVTIWLAFFLGCLQGLTEFLPVSSSGHLLLFQKLFGLEHLEQYLLFDIVCHLGTLLAIFVGFQSEWKRVLEKSLFRSLFWATLPLLPLVFLRHPLKSLMQEPWVLSGSFFLSALLIWQSQSRIEREVKSTDPFWIGVAQAVAILPGVSRSGATISVARLLGWGREEAFRFSFLLAIPAILGGTIVEIASFSSSNLSFSQLFVGFGSSFIVGRWTLQRVLWILKSEKWHYFAWYCLLLGIVNLCTPLL